MQTKLKIVQGNSKEKFIIDTELLNKYSEDLTREKHWTNRIITWSSIWDILKWIEENNINVEMQYIPYKKLVICL